MSNQALDYRTPTEVFHPGARGSRNVGSPGQGLFNTPLRWCHWQEQGDSRLIPPHSTASGESLTPGESMFWYLYPEMETKFQMVDIMLSAMSMEDWKEGPGKEEMKKEEEPVSGGVKVDHAGGSTD